VARAAPEVDRRLMSTSQIVVVEADEAIATGLVEMLRLDGYAAHRVTMPEHLTAVAGPVDLVIVDLDSAPADALAAGGTVRTAHPDAMVVALGSDRHAHEDADCLVKPFALADVRARVRNLLRRNRVGADRIVVEDVELDRVARRVWRDGREVRLRPKELDLLVLLLEHAGSALPRRRIMRELWHDLTTNSTKTLDVHLSALRRKLGDRDGTRIVTVRGVGYRYELAVTVGRADACDAVTATTR
jgi:DNA-binding response OmpR family regulator